MDVRFYDFLFKYGLHDCQINKIEIHGNILKLFFNDGIYLLNSDGKEVAKTHKCIIDIYINISETFEIYNYLDIIRFHKKKHNDISYDKFIDELNKDVFDIDINYFSYFNNNILIEGFIKTNKYQFNISDIYKIEFNFS